MNFQAVFCTVFDKNYLFQGVTLYRSLERALPSFKLYCLALDAPSVDTLQKLQLRSLSVVTLADLPQDQVQEIRNVASYGQFCWAMQPLICKYVLDQGNPHSTYIEADAYFFSSPVPLLQEIGNYSACVAPHWYSSSNLGLEAIAGKYCTHFNYFKNDTPGREVLEYWRTQCFLYRKEKPLYYPGQLALNDWPSLFPQVYELKNRGAGVAPWNVQQYVLGANQKNQNTCPTVDGNDVIFYHYHQLVYTTHGQLELGLYPLSDKIIETFYAPYVRALVEAEKLVKAVNPHFKYKREVPPPPSILQSLLSANLNLFKKATQPLRRKLKGNYNVFPLSFFGIKNG